MESNGKRKDGGNMKMKKCVICKEPYEGYGNNAYPVKDGICCDDCNLIKVIPARLKTVDKIIIKTTPKCIKLFKKLDKCKNNKERRRLIKEALK